MLAKGSGHVFSSLEEARAAYDHDEVGLQASVKVRLKGRIMDTTVGRALLSDLIPNEIPFEIFNKVVGKKELAELVDVCFRILWAQEDGSDGGRSTHGRVPILDSCWPFDID